LSINLSLKDAQKVLAMLDIPPKPNKTSQRRRKIACMKKMIGNKRPLPLGVVVYSGHDQADQKN